VINIKEVFMSHTIYEQVKQRLQRSELAVPRFKL
jgi:hypothetical protein